MSKYINEFYRFIKQVKQSNNLWFVPQQKGAKSFTIKVASQKNKQGFEVEKRVMPVDTFFPLEIFIFIIEKLGLTKEMRLKKGNAMKCKIGQPGLTIDTIEALVAMKFYNKKEGDSVDRRISVIANILVESGVCIHGKGELILRNSDIKMGGNNPIGIENPTKTPIVPIQKSSISPIELPKYLIENRNKIIEAPDQYINLINKNYSKDYYLDFDIMKEFHKRFPNLKKVPIQRDDVSKLFKNKEYYLGFISAMIWGGINASRPKETAKFETIDFYKLLKQDPKLVIAIIKQVENLLIKGKIKECFEFLQSDEGKLHGVGYPYFTKLMYFISHQNSMIKTKPLIFDKWTSNAYFALLINSNQNEKINTFFTKSVDPEYKTVGLRSNKSTTYQNYILDMEKWAKMIDVTPSKLEEYIFGVSLKIEKSKNNPRNQLWDIIINYKESRIKEKDKKR